MHGVFVQVNAADTVVCVPHKAEGGLKQHLFLFLLVDTLSRIENVMYGAVGKNVHEYRRTAHPVVQTGIVKLTELITEAPRFAVQMGADIIRAELIHVFGTVFLENAAFSVKLHCAFSVAAVGNMSRQTEFALDDHIGVGRHINAAADRVQLTKRVYPFRVALLSLFDRGKILYDTDSADRNAVSVTFHSSKRSMAPVFSALVPEHCVGGLRSAVYIKVQLVKCWDITFKNKVLRKGIGHIFVQWTAFESFTGSRRYFGCSAAHVIAEVVNSGIFQGFQKHFPFESRCAVIGTVHYAAPLE